MRENMRMSKKEKQRLFTRTLFRWHKTHYRTMAWRNTRDPYHILVSELMLQQTPVARVKEKYPEFIKKFPGVGILARAPLADVLRVWSGLGYNRRAKYLHECAKMVVLEHGGKFPSDMDTLRKLPGIGLSTAGALMAFAWSKDEPMIDTNIRRILTRVFFPKKRSRPGLGMERSSDGDLYEFAKTIIPRGEGREWNYAMLDLGATVCTARNHSELCPLGSLHGRVGDFSWRIPQKKFSGSSRFYRGKIMRYLSEHSSGTAREMKGLVPGGEREITLALHALAKEKLIAKKGARYALPS